MIIKEIRAEDTWEIRHKVMWPEKDLEYVRLKDDHKGMHYGVFDNNKIVSVISLFFNGDVAQFRKFATLKEEQGKGYGRELLKFVIKKSKEDGMNYIWCNARYDKMNFYKKFGMMETNESFQKGGIKYMIMKKYLNN
ncbi:MAG: GNAT family N-acetyltransferase [Marinisporobacter sp.]|nr:GNAT family N-acetyltransferase [Marinisporobacter sp.]